MAGGIQWKFTYNSSVARSLKTKLEKDIIKAAESSPALRQEIRRVFQMANRRIQNIEKSGVFSPAVAALGKGDVKGYSKFSVKGFGNSGSSWQALKKEYAKAVSFLNQPTSTASGAKQFEAQVKKEMGLEENLWKGIRDSILGNYNSVSSDLLFALPYSDFMQEVYSRAASASSTQMEQEARANEAAAQAEIDNLAKKLAQETVDGIEDMVKSLAKGFKIDF